MVTKEILNKYFSYNPETGLLIRNYIEEQTKHDKMYNTRFAGSSPTSRDSKGYLTTRVRGKTYRVSRLIYLIMAGMMPEQVDHINRNKNDNRWVNLRCLSNQENCFNRGKYKKGMTSSKYEGVSIHRKTGKWRAQIAIGGKKKHIGLFISEIDAYLAYKKEYEILTGGIKYNYDGDCHPCE